MVEKSGLNTAKSEKFPQFQILSVPNESVLSFTEMEESQFHSEQAQNLPF